MERKIKYNGKVWDVDIGKGGKVFINRSYYEEQLGFLASNGIWLSRNHYEVIKNKEA